MLWTFFVLDCDATFSCEEFDSEGVAPGVYLIPEDKIVEVQGCAKEAGLRFTYSDTDFDPQCIGDYFEDFMKENNIPFRFVGTIDIPFGERQVDYLVDYIAKEIV